MLSGLLFQCMKFNIVRKQNGSSPFFRQFGAHQIHITAKVFYEMLLMEYRLIRKHRRHFPLRSHVFRQIRAKTIILIMF